MDPKSSLTPSSFLSFFLLFSSATAFNITKLLGQHPEFKTFNEYLTQTQLASEINKRQTITVLVVDEKGLSSVSGKPTDVIKNALSLHVVLDYYDVDKLQKLSNKTALLTTLFQSSGSANGQQGFLNVTDLSSGQVAFGSAEKGSSLHAKLVKSVAAQPYNISVIQVSSVIVPGEIENKNSTSKAPSAAPKKSPTQAPTPSKSPSTGSPAKAPSAHSPKSAKAPAPSNDSSSTAPSSDAPSEADAPSDAPAEADAPADADAPVSSPPASSIADGPGADGPGADGPSGEGSAPGPEGASSGTRVALGMSFAIFTGIVSSIVAFYLEGFDESRKEGGALGKSIMRGERGR